MARLHLALSAACAAVLVTIIVSACGGGGGGDGDELFVAGTWTGTATLTENTCNLSDVFSAVAFTHTVNQNNEAVVLTDGTTTYIGNTVGDNGFSVDAAGNPSRDIGAGVTCAETKRIEYDEIEGATDDTAGVTLRTDLTCTNGAGCRVSYSGSATRNGVPPETTTTTTTTTTLPAAALACENLAERTFSGDGGCGIMSINVTVSTSGTGSPVIVLEPLGVNGATSFTQSSSDPRAAGSTRTDLTINGAAGYSCALVCSSPNTFHLNCFKEGAASCSEQF